MRNILDWDVSAVGQDRYCFAEMRMLRKEIELLRAERPCQARLLEVRSDIKETNDIKGDPHYVPECTDDGKKWRVRLRCFQA